MSDKNNGKKRPPIGDDDEFYTRQEAARKMRISLRKLDIMLATNELPFVKLGDARNNKVLIRKKDVDDYLNSCYVCV